MTDILPVSTGMGFGNGDGFGADALGAFGGAFGLSEELRPLLGERRVLCL